MPLQLPLQARSVMSSESRLSPWVCNKGNLKKNHHVNVGPSSFVCWLINPMNHITILKDVLSISETIVIGTINPLSYCKRPPHCIDSRFRVKFPYWENQQLTLLIFTPSDRHHDKLFDSILTSSLSWEVPEFNREPRNLSGCTCWSIPVRK